MANLIWTDDEDSTVVISRFILQLSPKDETTENVNPADSQLCIKAENALEAKRIFDVVNLFMASSDLVFSNASEKDAEFFFTFIISYLSKSENENECKNISDLIVDKIASDSSDKYALRLKLLFVVYNMQKNPNTRFSIFMKILEVARSGELTELVMPCVKKIKLLIKEWSLISVEQRDLYFTLHRLLKNNKSYAKESFSFLISYLETFEGEEINNFDEIKSYSVTAVVEFIKSNDMFNSDLLDLAAIRMLENDKEHSPLFSLLQIFLTSQLDHFYAFYKNNSSFVDSLGIPYDHLVTKMRLLSFSSLAETSTHEISYSKIQQVLQIEEDEIEEWIIRAINAKVLDAKMSQTRQVVIVNKCAKRVFGAAQWIDLKNKVSSWKENVSSMAKSFQNARISGNAAITQQALAY